MLSNIVTTLSKLALVQEKLKQTPIDPQEVFALLLELMRTGKKLPFVLRIPFELKFLNFISVEQKTNTANIQEIELLIMKAEKLKQKFIFSGPHAEHDYRELLVDLSHLQSIHKDFLSYREFLAAMETMIKSSDANENLEVMRQNFIVELQGKVQSIFIDQCASGEIQSCSVDEFNHGF